MRRKPMTDPEIIQRVVYMAKRTPTWGYDKLVGVFAHVGIKLSRSTVKRILDDHGIVLEPDRRWHIEWKELRRVFFLRILLHKVIECR